MLHLHFGLYYHQAYVAQLYCIGLGISVAMAPPPKHHKFAYNQYLKYQAARKRNATIRKRIIQLKPHIQKIVSVAVGRHRQRFESQGLQLEQEIRRKNKSIREASFYRRQCEARVHSTHTHTVQGK